MNGKSCDRWQFTAVRVKDNFMDFRMLNFKEDYSVLENPWCL